MTNVAISGDYTTSDAVYGYLNDGTRIRYATMTPNFSPKTRPGRVNAVAGSGGLAYVSKKRPRPGIKPRKFDELVVKGTKNSFEKAAERAIAKSARATGQII